MSRVGKPRDTENNVQGFPYKVSWRGGSEVIIIVMVTQLHNSINMLKTVEVSLERGMV